MMIDGIIGTLELGMSSWDVTTMDVEIEYEDEEQLEVSFDTAWSPPEPICYRLREMFKEIMSLGSIIARNGVCRVSVGQFRKCPLGVAIVTPIL